MVCYYIHISVLWIKTLKIQSFTESIEERGYTVIKGAVIILEWYK